jgi:predicted amidohydrolase YtcJ
VVLKHGRADIGPPRRRVWIRLVGGIVWPLAVFSVPIQAEDTPGDHSPDSQWVGPADLVIVGAKVWTGVKTPPSKPGEPPEAKGVAVIRDTIVAVGSDEVVRTWIGPTTKVIEAAGRRVIPGITDSHTHIVAGGFQLDRLMLRNAPGRDEFVEAVAAAAKSKKKGEWVTGGRWSVESWADPRSPNAAWLDPVTGEVPVFLNRMDGHQALVNSVALRLAGIDASSPPDPVGGEIERDPQTRRPTGILKESAMDLVSRLIPEPALAEQYDALVAAMKHANSLGITSVHDMCEPGDLEAFRKADAAGALTVRITAYVAEGNWSAHMDDVIRLKSELDGPMLRVAGFKGFMDGSLGSRTAYMREPFSDSTANTAYPRGQLTAFAGSSESFRDQVASADARDLQLAVHAIGDEANHVLLDAYETAAKKNGSRNRRHRIEHAQHLQASDIRRFASLDVVASMQPFHKADDGRYAEMALGRERLAGSYAFRQLVDAGASVIFGSDWPVVTLDPFTGIDAAVNAKTLSGEVWLPSHSLTIEEALSAYTSAPPKAVHQENRLGTLEPGKLADIVILSDDPLTLPPEQLPRVKGVTTIVAGRVVFAAAK